MHHSFDIKLAEEYGMSAALIIHHLQNRCGDSLKNKRNIRDGRFWTSQAVQDIGIHFPYLSARKIQIDLKMLVDEEILVKGNYNKTSCDRTVWYAFKNEDKWLG